MQNVNMVINFIFDLWQERKSKLYCQSLCIALLYLFVVSGSKHVCSVCYLLSV